MDQKEKDSQRIIFLKLFTREILFSLMSKYRTIQNIQTEKVKLKIFKEDSAEETEQAFNRVITKINTDERENIEEKEESKDQKRMTTIHRENLPNSLPAYPVLVPLKKEKTEKEKIIIQEKKRISDINAPPDMERSMSHKEDEKPITQEEEKIPEVPKANQQRINLKKLLSRPVQNNILSPMEKIEPMLKDNTVVAIECPGPGKNVLIRKYNQVNMTKVVLSEEEINAIIDYFSKEAKIPLAGGILKAAVGNSVISAVVSEFVGSRFVINKITPYSLIGQK